jgi:ribonuclease P protein component
MPNDLGWTRCGFSVSRRVGNAVRRNRVKRRLREIMRKTSLKAGWDIVVIARPSAGESGYRALAEELNRLLGRGGLLAVENEKISTGTN